MKKIKHKMIIILLFVCVSSRLPAEIDDMALLFEEPADNPTVEGYFTEVMNSVHTEMLGTTPCVCFFDLIFFFIDPLQLNLSIGFMQPVFKNVALVIFGELVTNESGDVSYRDHWGYYIGAMGGGGLVIHGRFGVLAGYVGYGGAEQHLTQLDSKGHRITIFDIPSEEKLQWAVFPVINAKEYPLLNTFVNLVDGFFSMDNLRMDRDNFQPSYKANVLFRDIRINGGRQEITLGTYTIKDWYNFDTKYELYAGKVDLSFPELFYSDVTGTIVAEGGYRKYFDTRMNKQYYESGIYTKISLRFYQDWFGVMLYLESGSKVHFSNPTMGIVFSMRFLENASIINWDGALGRGNFEDDTPGSIDLDDLSSGKIALNFRIHEF